MDAIPGSYRILEQMSLLLILRFVFSFFFKHCVHDYKNVNYDKVHYCEIFYIFGAVLRYNLIIYPSYANDRNLLHLYFITQYN